MAHPPFVLRRLAPGDLPAFRALHDACLEVSYDDAFYGTLRAGRDRHGHALLSLAALDAAGALVGGLSVRLAPPSSHPSSDGDGGGGGRRAWAWADLLLPLRLLGHALQALWRGDAEEPEAGGDAPVVAYIMTLCVAPSARRQGLARALIQVLLDEVPRHCIALELHMLEGNAAATRLYASLEFVRGERHPNYYFFDNQYHHAVTWRRDLGYRSPAAAGAASAGSGAAGAEEPAEPAAAHGTAAAPGAGGGSDAV